MPVNENTIHYIYGHSKNMTLKRFAVSRNLFCLEWLEWVVRNVAVKLEALMKLRFTRRGLIFIALCLVGLGISVLIGVGVWIWHIDSTWSPIIEPRIKERQQVGSIRVMAQDLKGQPKWIGSLTAGRMEERQPLKLSEVPPQMVQSIVVLEDPRFLQHGGFDVLGIVRAAGKNLVSMRYGQGGSTITQQLVKNVFLTSKKTLRRKFTELVLSAMIENRFSKDEILEAYMNEVYLGQLGAIEIHGVGRAAEYYFGKKVDQLEIHEMALLAAMIAGPGVYSPWKAPDKTRARRDRVLRSLFEAKLILPEEYESALKKPLPPHSTFIAPTRAAYLMDALRENLLQERGEMDLLKGGFDLQVGLDLELQELAEKSLQEKAQQAGDAKAQGLVVAADPVTCEVRAYVGGTNYQVTQLDRIRQSKRAIGSLMKPLEISRVLDDDAGKLSLATVLKDEPLEWSFDSGRSKWKPLNYDNKFRGPVTLRKALEESLNVPIVRVFFERVPSGLLQDTFDPVRALGLEIPQERALPSALLGSVDQTPWNTLQAYVKLVRQAMGIAGDAGDFGCRLSLSSTHANTPPSETANPSSAAASPNTPPATIPAQTETPPSAPVTKEGAAAPESPAAPAEAKNSTMSLPEYGKETGFAQNGARLTIAALEGALRRGTSRSLGAKLPINQTWAGKTGTSSDGRDAWYASLSPRLVLIAWAGRDDNGKTKFTGASGALPLVAPLIEAWSKREEIAKGWKWPSTKEMLWKPLRLDGMCRPPEIQIALIKSGHPEPIATTPPPEAFKYEDKDYIYEVVRQGAEAPECP